MICKICGKETIKDWRKNKKSKHNLLRFCSRSCANTRNFLPANRIRKKAYVAPIAHHGKVARKLKRVNFVVLILYLIDTIEMLNSVLTLAALKTDINI